MMKAHYLETAVLGGEKPKTMSLDEELSTEGVERLQPVLNNLEDQAAHKVRLLDEERAHRLNQVAADTLEVVEGTDQSKVIVDGVRWLEGKFPDSYQLQLSFVTAMFRGEVEWEERPIDIVIKTWMSQPTGIGMVARTQTIYPKPDA